MSRKQEFINLFNSLPIKPAERVAWCCEAAGVRPSAVYAWCSRNKKQPSEQSMLLLRHNYAVLTNASR